jgi:hypothetical protein
MVSSVRFWRKGCYLLQQLFSEGYVVLVAITSLWPDSSAKPGVHKFRPSGRPGE